TSAAAQAKGGPNSAPSRASPSVSRSMPLTLAPCATSSRATSRPMPLAAPVIRAVLPRRSVIFSPDCRLQIADCRLEDQRGPAKGTMAIPTHGRPVGFQSAICNLKSRLLLVGEPHDTHHVEVLAHLPHQFQHRLVDLVGGLARPASDVLDDHLHPLLPL